MKLNARVAGICASGTFIITTLPAFFTQWKPNSIMGDSFSGVSLVESLLFSVLGALLAGFIGFLIGSVLSKPAGKKKKTKSPHPDVAAPKTTSETSVPAPTVSQEKVSSEVKAKFDDDDDGLAGS